MKRLLLILVASLLPASSPALAQGTPDFETLAAHVRTTKQRTGHPFATAVAVVKDGKLIYQGYFGYQDIQQQIPATRNTVFYIASATKPFLALNILLKQHQGKLDTDTSLHEMFPDIRFGDIDADKVSIRNLLVHTSGVDNGPLTWATAFSGIHDARLRHRLVAASYPNTDAPLGNFDYTNVGYNILSVWLDEHFAVPWQDQLDNAIFQPLGMRHTSAYMSEAKAKQWPLAKQYSFASESPNQPLYLVKANNTMHAAGGMVSTAPDLAKFLITQLGGDGSDDKTVLPKAVISASHESQATLEASYLDFARSGYAWGWYRGEYKNRTMLHHFGGFSGFHAHLSFMPAEGIGLVVLNNDDMLGARLTNLIADYVYGKLLDEKGVEDKLAKRFDQLLVKAKGFRSMLQKQRQEIRARPWNLSLPNEAYTGIYSNELLGNMSVALDDDGQMIIRWGRLTTTTTGYAEQNRVRVSFAPNSGHVLAFQVEDGSVQSLEFNDMSFRKQP